MLSLRFLLLPVIFPAANAWADCGRYSYFGADFRQPYEVQCVDHGTVGFLAPGLGDFSHRIAYRGNPSFVTATGNVDWARSVFSKENRTRFAAVSSKSEALRGLSFQQVIAAAALKTASSREDLDRTIQARCAIFTSSNICRSAVDMGASMSCSGRAEAIASAGSDRSSNQEKLRVLLNLGKELGVEDLGSAAFFAVLRYAAPALVEPAVQLFRAYYIFQAGSETYGDMRDVLEVERSSWFQAFVKAQANRELEQYCYKGAEQFKFRMRNLYYSAIASYSAYKKATNPPAKKNRPPTSRTNF